MDCGDRDLLRIRTAYWTESLHMGRNDCVGVEIPHRGLARVNIANIARSKFHCGRGLTRKVLQKRLRGSMMVALVELSSNVKSKEHIHEPPCPFWVKSGHDADVARCPLYPESGHQYCRSACPLWANNRHQQESNTVTLTQAGGSVCLRDGPASAR